MKFFIIFIISCIYGIHEIKSYSLNSITNLKSFSFSELFKMKNSEEPNSNKPKSKEKYVIYVIHQGNLPLNGGKGKKFKINFDDEGIMIFSTKNGKKEIPMQHLHFIGDQMISRTNELESINNPMYKDFAYKNFVPAIKKISSEFKEVADYGLVLIHHKVEIENATRIEKDLAIIISPTDDMVKEGRAQAVMDKIKNKIEQEYQKTISNFTKFKWDLPKMIKRVHYPFYIWNNLEYFKEVNDKYAQLATEGLVLKKFTNHTILTDINFAFRYDQIYLCEGYKNSTADIIPEQVKNVMPTDECCVGFNVNWHERPTKEVFCSKAKLSSKCVNEISVFRKFVYRECVESGIRELAEMIEKNERFDDKNLTVLSRIRNHFILETLKRNEIFNQAEPNTDVQKNLDIIKKNLGIASSQIKTSLEGIDIGKFVDINQLPKSSSTESTKRTTTITTTTIISGTQGQKQNPHSNNQTKVTQGGNSDSTSTKATTIQIPSTQGQQQVPYSNTTMSSIGGLSQSSTTTTSTTTTTTSYTSTSGSQKSEGGSNDGGSSGEYNYSKTKVIIDYTPLINAVIQNIKTSLVRNLTNEEVVVIKNLVPDLHTLFQNVLEKGLWLPNDIFKKNTEGGVSSVSDWLYRFIKSSNILVKYNLKKFESKECQNVTNQKFEIPYNNTQPNKKNHTTPEKNKVPVMPSTIPRDKDTEYVNEDDNIDINGSSIPLVIEPKNKTLSKLYFKS